MTTGNQYARHDLSVWNKQQKSHLISQNVFLQNIIYPSEKKKKLLEQAAFWHEVKVVCCLPTPFFTLWTRLPRSTCFKGGFHSHMSAESSQNQLGLGWNGNMEHSENHSGKKTNKTHADERKVITLFTLGAWLCHTYDWIYFKFPFCV